MTEEGAAGLPRPAGGEEGASRETPALRGGETGERVLATTLRLHEQRVMLAMAKRERGEPLTTVERRLLACEDRGITPEILLSRLARIAVHEDKPGDRIRASTKVAAALGIFALRDGPDPEAPPPAPPPPGITVNVGVGVSLTVADLEAAKESARKKLTAIMARVRSVPAHVVDSGQDGTHRGNGSGVPAADGAGGGPGPAAGSA